RVVAYVAEALYDRALAGEPGLKAERLHVGCVAAHLTQAEVDAPARRALAAAHAAGGQRLAGHAPCRVELGRRERRVRVDHPRHLTAARAVVGRGNVDGRADHVAGEQLERVPPGDALELGVGVARAVYADAALRSAEGHIDERALVRHDGREGDDLVLVDVHGVAHAALARQLVFAVLGPPAVDDLDRAVVPAEREAHVVDGVAGLDLLQETRRVRGQCGGLVEVAVDLLEERDT